MISKKVMLIISLLILNINLVAIEDSLIAWRLGTFIPNQEKIEIYNPKKPLWIPVVETVGLNVLVWSYNRFIDKRAFAYINLETMASNIKGGLKYDADDLKINFWFHPFQGAMYFNTARSLGHDYFDSMLVTAIGSLQWEFFMENEPPAVNDMVITILGGAMFGEAFYRISSLIIDENSSNFERVGRELLAGAFNPGRLMNRLIFSRSKRSLKDGLYNKERYFMNVAVGVNNIPSSLSSNLSKDKKNTVINLMFLYGNLEKKKTIGIFDIFRLNMMVNINENRESALGEISLASIFYGRQFSINNHKIVLSLNQSFDYLKNDIYQIAALDLGGELLYKSPKAKYWGINFMMGAYVIPMGGVNSDYAKNYIVDGLGVSRDYNLSFGLSLKSSIIVFLPYTIIALNYDFWRFNTYQGAKGVESIGILKPSISFKLVGRVRFGLQLFLYQRVGKYVEHKNISTNHLENRIFLSFDF